MLNQVVTRLARWMPRPQPIREPRVWEDSDPSWHNSSHDLAQGLQVLELFDSARRPLPHFADTLPAFHEPQPPTLAHQRR